MTTPARAAGNIRELCSLGTAPSMILPDLFKALRELVQADYCAMIWSDATGEPRGGSIELDGRDAYLERYQTLYCNRRELEVTRGFTDTMWNAAPVRTEQEHLVVPWRHFFRHDYYNEILSPLGGLRDCFKLILRERQQPLGTVLIFRGANRVSRPYNALERHHISTIYPHLCHALGSPTASDEPAYGTTDAHRALLICNLNGRLDYLSPSARALMPLLADGDRGQRQAECLPDRLRPLLRRLHRIRSGKASPPAHLDIRTPSGRIQARAQWLDSTTRGDANPLIAIMLSRYLPLPLLWWRRLTDMDLSHRQLQVALLIMRDLPLPDIADRLNLAPSSVTTHARQIYSKAGVRSARQLRLRVNENIDTLATPPTGRTQ